MQAMSDPKLRFACPARWEDMRISVLGRHCGQCDKQVVDFTKGSKQDILDHLQANPGRSVCGHIRRDQVDAHRAVTEVVIYPRVRNYQRHNQAYYLIAATGLALASCTGGSGPRSTPVDTAVSPDSTRPIQREMPDTSMMLGQLTQPVPVDVVVEHLEGEVAFEMPEPEFPGGNDSLIAFLRRNVEYPEWEAANKIEGSVSVEFTVAVDGSVSDPKIMRNVDGSKNLDAEVLRVIHLMPKWEPGKADGRSVSCKYWLPIRFSLPKDQ